MLLIHFIDAFSIRFEEDLSSSHLKLILSIQFIFYQPSNSGNYNHYSRKNSSTQMSEVARKQQQNQAKFQKVIEKYEHRFQNTLSDFKKFVETRVIMDAIQIQKLFDFVKQRFDQEFDKSDLEHLMHILSAHQAGKTIQAMTSKEIKSYYRIKFIIKKGGQNGDKQKKQEKDSGNNEKRGREKQKYEEEERKKQEKRKREKREAEMRAQQQRIEQQKRQSAFHYQQVQQISDDEPKQENPRLISSIGHNDRLNTILEQSERNTQQIETANEIYSDQFPKYQRSSTQKIDVMKGENEQMYASERSKKQEKKQQKLQYEVVVDPNLQRQSQDSEQFEKSQNTKNSGYGYHNSPEIAQDLTMDDEVITISRYEKTGQDFMNPVIKFQIIYKNSYTTWRRYSEIERLMVYLRKKYEGVVLPEMPPKQGLKSGFTYLWGIDKTFLFDRKEKLNTMLNRLMQKNEVNKDSKLIKFLTDQNYEIPVQNSQDYWNALSGWKDIVLNYSQLKDYGVAYYKYVSEYKNRTITTELAHQYQQLQEEIKVIRAADQYRRKINANFDKRREIMDSLNIQVRQPCKTQLDKILDKASIQCKEMAIQYANYVQLKSNESWLMELKKQKEEQQGTKTITKIKTDLEQTTKRINKIETNFSISIKEYKNKLKQILQKLGLNMIEWRQKVHP